MPIEFRCTHCDRLLRTPDGTSGKEAKCPQCGAIVKIPEQAQQASAPPPVPEPSPHVETGNPYQSPSTTMMAARPQGEMRRGFHPARIEFSDVLSRTWQIFKANLWPCVGVAAFLLAISYGEAIGFAIFTGGRRQTLPESLFSLAFGVVQFWLTLGLMTYFLKTARGEPAEFVDLFSAGPFLLRAMGISIIFGILVLIGFILLVVPGVIIMMMLSPSWLVLIDRNVGVVEALSMSREATNGNKLTLSGLYIVIMFASSFIILFTCGLGLFFVQPFVLLLFCVCYLAMTGQSTADQASAR
ncbi:MAG: hypothetical protein HY288_11845 [Planctomycetia bacterium]|nr:hypothetical protein [Planctomycetia bacterium]